MENNEEVQPGILLCVPGTAWVTVKWKLTENLKENHYSYYRVQNDGTPLMLMCYSSVAGFHTWGISPPNITILSP